MKQKGVERKDMLGARSVPDIELAARGLLMGRTPTYTAREDAIILATVGLGVEETNALLIKEGFLPRTDNAIYGRRHYLKRHPDGTDLSVAQLSERKDAYKRAYETAREAYLDIVAQLNEKMGEEQAAMQKELARLVE